MNVPKSADAKRETAGRFDTCGHVAAKKAHRFAMVDQDNPLVYREYLQPIEIPISISKLKSKLKPDIKPEIEIRVSYPGRIN